MSLSVLELGRMYNAFAKRRVHCTLQENALLRVHDLYEHGYSLVVGIVINAYNLARTDTRRNTVLTLLVEAYLSGVPFTFTVICTVSVLETPNGSEDFVVHFIIPNEPTMMPPMA